MKNRKILCLFLAVCLAAALAACSPYTAAPSAAPEPTPEEPPAPTQAPVVTSVSGVMTAEEVEALGNNKDLVSVDLSGSTCYEAIIAYAESHPNVTVTYTVDIGGSAVSPKIESLDLNGLDFTVSTLSSVVRYLPCVKSVCFDADKLSLDEISCIEELFPEAEVSYTVTVLGNRVESTVQTIDASAMTSADIEATAEAVKKLPMLECIDAAGSSLTLDEAKALAAAAPNAGINYPVELFGKTFSLSDECLEYVDEKIGNEGVSELRDILPAMNKCTRVLLDKCEIDNEVLAELRDDFPEKNVVWHIFFCGYEYYTDTDVIWATGRVTDGYTSVLKYCTEVKYLDMGHNCITNIDFCNYMPKLEVAIFSPSWVEDISPLANCPELEYLEIFSSRVTDISPLASCTKLQHLNISRLEGVKDISPLYGLTELKRLRCTCHSLPQDQIDEIMSLMPDCNFCFKWEDPTGGDWRYNEDGSLVERYQLLQDQFDYTNPEKLAVVMGYA